MAGELEVIKTNTVDFFYYKKKMITNTKNYYYSHVFYTKPLSNDKLREEWKTITSIVAVRYQSKTKELIERSNYYICFFTDGKIEDKLIEEIEGDEFSARKYILSEDNYDERQVIKSINDKLFGFVNEAENNLINNPIHMSSITLKNFRAYKDVYKLRFTYDYSVQDMEAASFVLVYAKNGVGKTSLFDGVEFLLKGEVDRINTLKLNNKKTGSPAVMYHNLNNPNKESYVSAVLTNGTQLERAVGKTDIDDSRRSRPRKGTEFIGERSEQAKWSEIILPHDSIDGFIMANKPETMYEEWVKHSDLQEQSKQFKIANEKKRQIQSAIRVIEDDRKNEVNKLNELNNSISSVESVVRLIRQFNEQKKTIDFPKGEDLRLSLEDGIESYVQLINNVNAYLRLTEEQLNNNVMKEECKLSIISKRGQEYYENKYHQYLDAKRKVEELQEQLKKRMLYDEIVNKMSVLEKEKAKCEAEIHSCEDILELGGEAQIRKKQFRKKELIQWDLIYRETCEKSQKNISSLEEQYDSIKASVEPDESLLEKYYSDREKARQYCDKKELLMSLDNNIKFLKTQIRYINELIVISKKKEEKIRAISLPSNLSDVSIETIQAYGELIGWESVNPLLTIKNEYSKTNMIIESLSRQLQDGAKMDEKIITMAGTYVIRHPDICECPVCGMNYETNQKLITAIESTSESLNDELKNRLWDNRNIAYEIEQDFPDKATRFREAIAKSINELQVEENKSIEKRDELASELSILLKNYDTHKAAIEEISAYLKKYNDEGEENVINAVEVWYETKRSENARKQAKMKKILDDKEIAEKEYEETVNKQKRVSDELRIMVTNIRLQNAMQYVVSKPDDWSAESSLIDLGRFRDQIASDYTKLKEDLKSLNNVTDSDSEYLSNLIQSYYSNMEYLREDKSTYEEYYANSGILQNMIAIINEKKETLKQEIEYLRQIKEEDKSRRYFDEYKLTDKKIKRLTQELDEERETLKRYQSEEDRLRCQLEKGLVEHFNQTIMNSIYKKIDPHRVMNSIKYSIQFSKDGTPLLFISVTDGEREIRPEWYFSTAQLNTLVFSAFFSRALRSNLPLKTIFIDDPIAHFDDMNILGFADLMRCLITKTSFQFVMSTHDRKIFEIMKRKLPTKYYKSRFIEL